MTEIKEKIIDALREVYDPEIPINIYDLGLIYDIDVEKNKVHILMTLTSPTCPTAEYIQTRVREAAEDVEGISDVSVELTFEPPWTPERVSQGAKEELGLGDSVEEIESVKNTFSVNAPIAEKICFNCGASQEIFPVIECFYKGERTFICTRCIGKFD